MLDSSDSLNQTAKPNYELAIKALGGCLCYLKQHLIDDELLTLKQFKEYVPSDLLKNETVMGEKLDSVKLPKYMILDSVTTKNLEIFENNNGEIQGTMLELMDFCITKSGKRLLRQWIAHVSKIITFV